MKFVYFFIALITVHAAQAQVAGRLQAAMQQFNNDEQATYALTSLYVVNNKTGQVVYNQNSKVGMATASTEKIITAATAMEVLGKDYRFETKFGIAKTTRGNALVILPSGDPTLGSWRWDATKMNIFLENIKNAFASTGIKKIDEIIVNTDGWANETLPDGWIWQDLGNYYGAPAQPLNWHENQYDLYLASGAGLGSATRVVRTEPVLYNYNFTTIATAAAKNTGDNTYLYFPYAGNKNGTITGTIPLGQSAFKVSGAMYDPVGQFVQTVIQTLKPLAGFATNGYTTQPGNKNIQWFYTHQSPELSKIVYWFLRKSVNLYGEALLKAVGKKQTGTAGTDAGIKAIQDFWKAKNIDPEMLHLYDGSGLSPQNRITTEAQVKILQYAKNQPWFDDYFEAFPLYNDMKMKSGTINRVKGFCGYHTAADGNEYVFSMLVNNYSGSEYAMIRKIFKVLDNLK